MSINDLIIQVQRAEAEAQAEEARKRAETRAEHERAEEIKRRTELLSVLGSEFIEDVQLTFSHAWPHGSHVIRATFPYGGVFWHLTPYQGKELWRVYRSSEVDRWGSEEFTSGGGELLRRLLIALGEHRKQQAQAERELAQRAEESRQRQAERERRQRLAAQERMQRIEQSQSEDARLRKQLDAVLAEAQAKLWQWPQGVTIEIYELQWCRGSFFDEESAETSFDYDGGWTTEARLDSQARIEVKPQRRYSHSNELKSGRTVQLDMEVHKPVWMVHRYASTMELPEQLRMQGFVHLENVIMRRNDDTDEPMLSVVDHLGFDEKPYQLEIGWKPLPWVCKLVEKAAGQKAD